MKASGMLTKDGARVVAETWKGTKFESSTRWEVFRDLNVAIQKKLFADDQQAVDPILLTRTAAQRRKPNRGSDQCPDSDSQDQQRGILIV
jgi:hypothetical protein